MEKSSPLTEQRPSNLFTSDKIIRPLPAREFTAEFTAEPTAEPADPMVQEQWIQPTLFLTIISPSRLLREALVQLLAGWSSRLTYSLLDCNTSSNPVHAARHLVLLDHGVGQEAALAYIQRWRARQTASWATEIVVLELPNESDTILDCIAAGAQGYVVQGAATAEIIQVVEQVLRGRARCSPEITAKLFKRLAETTVSLPKAKPLLTQRELEVLHSIARGCSDRDIAAELVIEVRTVKHHVHNLLRKLEVKCRWQAAQLAIDNCWFDPIDQRDRA